MGPSRGCMLDSDAGEALVFGGITILVRVPTAYSGGAFTMYEETPPIADMPLHLHEREDEVFRAPEGEHIVPLRVA